MDEFRRVIYVLETTDLAGGVRVVFEQANRLAVFGVRVEIYSLQGRPDWFHLRVPVYKFPDYQTLGCALRGQRAAKIATYWATAPVVAANARVEEGFYLVQDMENWFYPGDRHTQREVLATYQLPLKLICVSKWVRDQLGQLGRMSTYVGIGINRDVFRPVTPQLRRSCRVLVNAPRDGILWHLKGMDTLSTALKLAANMLPKLEIVSFSTSVHPFDIPGINITHLTLPSDQTIATLYNSASCFVLASRHEGFCLPALEAMACGCVVVTTRAGGNEEFCIDKETCLLVEPENPLALAKGMLRALNDEPIVGKLRERGLLTAKFYGWERAIRNLLIAIGLGVGDYEV